MKLQYQHIEIFPKPIAYSQKRDKTKMTRHTYELSLNELFRHVYQSVWSNIQEKVKWSNEITILKLQLGQPYEINIPTN